MATSTRRKWREDVFALFVGTLIALVVVLVSLLLVLLALRELGGFE
jgi:hypothetical protein